MRRNSPRASGRERGASSHPAHRPRKRFGQHFLADTWATKVVAAVAPLSGDTFLEIGPGTGALTRPLARTGVPVLAVEIDRGLAADLARDAPPNVTILVGDFLKTDVVPLLRGLTPQRPAGLHSPSAHPRRFRVVGNLPYYITTPILFRLLDLDREAGLFSDATMMVQREVADRLVARPGTREYGALTILAGLRARVTRLLDLPPGAFTPPPKVKSSVIKVEFGFTPIRVPDEALLERMVKAMFSQRRKTLGNALKSFDRTTPAVLALARIDPGRRPETLQLSEIARLAELFASVRRGPVL